MKHDIYLRVPVIEKEVNVLGHLMTGSTYKAEYHPETGTYTPAMNTEA